MSKIHTLNINRKLRHQYIKYLLLIVQAFTLKYLLNLMQYLLGWVIPHRQIEDGMHTL